MQSAYVNDQFETRNRDLNGRLEEIGWALFLTLLGVLWLLPAGYFTSTAWLIGAGVIMLGMNFARYFLGIGMSGFTVFLGIVALVAGFSGSIGVEFPIVPAVLIVLGASLLMRAIFKQRS
jgi:hypothetical protein